MRSTLLTRNSIALFVANATAFEAMAAEKLREPPESIPPHCTMTNASILMRLPARRRRGFRPRRQTLSDKARRTPSPDSGAISPRRSSTETGAQESRPRPTIGQRTPLQLSFAFGISHFEVCPAKRAMLVESVFPSICRMARDVLRARAPSAECVLCFSPAMRGWFTRLPVIGARRGDGEIKGGGPRNATSPAAQQHTFRSSTGHRPSRSQGSQRDR